VAGFDLRAYLDRFPEVCEREFGQKYNFRALEKDFYYLRNEKSWLSAKHVLSLFDSKRTPFARYWQKPDQRELDRILSERHLCLALPADGSRDEELIRRLLDVLHNAGTASLVLRFTYPERFGTFSTPLVHLLYIQREETIEHYRAYCEELREWQMHFGMASVAETETAVWTFHKLATGSKKITADETARRQFDSDLWIQRRRVAQALRPFFDRYRPLELARIITEEHPKLAAMIAGEEYERLLRYAAQRFYKSMRLDVKGAVENLLMRLEEDGRISLEEKTLLRKAWRVRNRAVHPDSSASLSPEEVDNMIDAMERICLPWGHAGGAR
jgi:hypothetical protein